MCNVWEEKPNKDTLTMRYGTDLNYMWNHTQQLKTKIFVWSGSIKVNIWLYKNDKLWCDLYEKLERREINQSWLLIWTNVISIFKKVHIEKLISLSKMTFCRTDQWTNFRIWIHARKRNLSFCFGTVMMQSCKSIVKCFKETAKGGWWFEPRSMKEREQQRA